MWAETPMQSGMTCIAGGEINPLAGVEIGVERANCRGAGRAA
jgi:hypothetical protein